MEYENYVFDLYGTLIRIHTDEHAKETWKHWLKYLNTQNIVHPRWRKCRRDFEKIEQAHRKKAGEEKKFEYPEIDYMKVYRELFEKYGNQDLSEEIVRNASYAFRTASRERMELYPGVKEFIGHLKNAGKKVYLLSNAQASYTVPEIENFGLEKMMDDIFISSDYGCMKPDKAFFDALLDKYDMDRDKTVMIGDSRFSDIEGAQKAGIHAIHLTGENAARKFYLNRI